VRKIHIDYPRAGQVGWRRYVPSWRQSLAIAGGFFIALFGAFGIAYATVNVPNPNDVAVAQTTVFTYAGGKTELGRDGAQNRQAVPLSDVPLATRHAVLAAEDRNFYSESGISPPGIARAFWVNLRGGGVSQGGSTITQQYVKNAYLTQQRTFSRKLKEIVISIKLAKQKSKDEIFGDYLNTIYFGRGAYGIETGAQAYFGRGAKQLDLSQSALLAAVIQSPGNLDPSAHPQAAKARWQYVLNGMVKEKWITQASADAQKFPPAGLIKQRRTPSSLAGPRGYLIRAAEVDMAAHGISENQLNLGGLRVETTIDKQAQDGAVKAVNDVVPGDAPKDLRTALVAVEPGSGRIRAMYGGSDYQKRQFNDALQGTAQPGSSFKPFVLVAALQHGISLTSKYDGRSPQTIHGQKVSNFGSEQFGKIDLVQATAHSVNTVYYQLGFDAGGPAEVTDVAKQAGVTAPVDGKKAGGSAFLGGGDTIDVHPVDMADAFGTFAAQGKHAPAYIVQKVTDHNGKTLYEAKPKTTQVFDRDVMADTTFALQAVLREGTATRAQLSGRPAAGKTGTTTSNRAAWFVGYTPQLSASVALFRDNNKPLQGVLGLSEVTGGSIPAKVWKAFMSAALQGKPVLNFPPPANLGAAATPTPTATPTATPTIASPLPSASPTAQPSKSGFPLPTPPIGPSPTPSASPSAAASAGVSQQPEPGG
jgi:membrane peptidoglycan carboxypeptidase